MQCFQISKKKNPARLKGRIRVDFRNRKHVILPGYDILGFNQFSPSVYGKRLAVQRLNASANRYGPRLATQWLASSGRVFALK